MAASVAHEFVDHPRGDAGVLQPGREGVPQVMWAAQLQVVQAVVAYRVLWRPAWLAVVGVLPGRQANCLQLPEGVVDGAERGAAAEKPAADCLGGLAGAGVAERP
jgi:hypothetical protein